MKKMIAISIAILITGCAAMNYEQLPEEERTFNQVFEAPGFSKDEIFNATKIWIAENFRSAKSVIEHEDKDEGILIGNGRIDYPCGQDDAACLISGQIGWDLDFTMRVDIKDEKFKLTFMNLIIDIPPDSYSSGSRMPVSLQSQMDVIKPRLLSYGDAILASMKRDEKQRDW